MYFYEFSERLYILKSDTYKEKYLLDSLKKIEVDKKFPAFYQATSCPLFFWNFLEFFFFFICSVSHYFMNGFNSL